VTIAGAIFLAQEGLSLSRIRGLAAPDASGGAA